MIVAEDLVKTFPTPDGHSRAAVNGLSFHVAAGEIYGLLGPNGAGKTTTLRILSALMRPTSGRAVLAGYDVVANPIDVKRSIGFLTASTGLYQRLTPREMLSYFAELHGLRGKPVRERVAALVETLGIGPFADLRCGALSTGQRQRTSIARALVADPPVLILDEPTLGLDVMSNRVILDFVRSQRAAGKAILLSTHYLSEAETLCDRVGLLHNGRLVAEGDMPVLRAATGRERLTDIFLSLVEASGGGDGGAVAATEVTA
jgi:sodium transport system ATP-binding protein